MEMSSRSVNSGPRILAHSNKLKERVRLTLIRVSRARRSWIFLSSGHDLGPRVNRTAGKLKAQ